MAVHKIMLHGERRFPGGGRHIGCDELAARLRQAKRIDKSKVVLEQMPPAPQIQQPGILKIHPGQPDMRQQLAFTSYNIIIPTSLKVKLILI